MWIFGFLDFVDILCLHGNKQTYRFSRWSDSYFPPLYLCCGVNNADVNKYVTVLVMWHQTTVDPPNQLAERQRATHLSVASVHRLCSPCPLSLFSLLRLLRPYIIKDLNLHLFCVVLQHKRHTELPEWGTSIKILLESHWKPSPCVGFGVISS